MAERTPELMKLADEAIHAYAAWLAEFTTSDLQSLNVMRLHDEKEAAHRNLRAALEAALGVLASADERMRHDYPILQQFHSKHALGALSAPSCLCCGQQTGPDRPIAVRHMELPAIVVCKPCKDAAAGVVGGAK